MKRIVALLALLLILAACQQEALQLELDAETQATTEEALLEANPETPAESVEPTEPGATSVQHVLWLHITEGCRIEPSLTIPSRTGIQYGLELRTADCEVTTNRIGTHEYESGPHLQYRITRSYSTIPETMPLEGRMWAKTKPREYNITNASGQVWQQADGGDWQLVATFTHLGNE